MEIEPGRLERLRQQAAGPHQAARYLVFYPAGARLAVKGAVMLKDFKEFALKGNVMDLAVGVIIGAAFGPIVTSLVNDILMPPIGLLVGGVDFSNLFVVLK